MKQTEKTIQERQLIHLFWTGGFDSTYRLLEIVLEKKLPVQPHYLIDSARLSTRIEINTIRKIKQILFEKYPFTQQLILPTIFMETADLQPNEEIKIAFQEINKHSHLGTQYDWLARYCHEKEINEMGITAVFRYDSHIESVLKNHVEMVERYNFPLYRIREDAYKLPEGIIFKYFLFPSYEKSKLELFQFAQEKGWGEMINLTWFCHKPRAGDKPCGACEPCRQTINYGLGFRIPYQNRIMGKILHSVYDSKLFQTAKRAVKGR